MVTYRLSGDPSHALDKFVPVVDGVIGLQFGEFARHVGTTGDNPGCQVDGDGRTSRADLAT